MVAYRGLGLIHTLEEGESERVRFIQGERVRIIHFSLVLHKNKFHRPTLTTSEHQSNWAQKILFNQKIIQEY